MMLYPYAITIDVQLVFIGLYLYAIAAIFNIE